MTENLYSIATVSKQTGLPASTLRYYDREGLLPDMQRSPGGARMFTDADLHQLSIIECLKQSGLSIKEIKRYIDLAAQGNATLEERRALIYGRREVVEEELAQLEHTRDFINYKCWYYDKAVELGDGAAVDKLPDSEVPEELRPFRPQHS